MTKKLKIWNGRGYGRGFYDTPRDHASPFYCFPSSVEHIFVCANSRAHAARLMVEHLDFYRTNNALSELKNYFNEGSWGNRMKGITEEVGVWVEVTDLVGYRKIVCIWKESDPDILSCELVCEKCGAPAIWLFRAPDENPVYLCDDHHVAAPKHDYHYYDRKIRKEKQ